MIHNLKIKLEPKQISNRKMHRFQVSIPIVIFIFGILGNIINILIFVKKHVRSSPSLRFLLYLSIADLIVIIMGISEVLLKSDYSLGLRDSSLFVCNIQKFVSYSSTYVSSCLTVAFNFYTAKTIIHITRYREMKIKPCVVLRRKFQTTKFVDSISLLILLLVFLLNSHFIFLLNPSLILSARSLELNETQLWYGNFEAFSCTPVKNSFYEYFLINVWLWIDVCLFTIIPFVSMMICSIIIIVNLMRLNRIYSTRFSLNCSRHIYKRKYWKNVQTSVMLVCSNIYFLLTMSIFWMWFMGGIGRLEENKERHILKQSIVYTFLYSNNSFGILFYALFSTQYRKEFITLTLLKSYF
jgi:hypothetical protein